MPRWWWCHRCLLFAPLVSRLRIYRLRLCPNPLCGICVLQFLSVRFWRCLNHRVWGCEHRKWRFLHHGFCQSYGAPVRFWAIRLADWPFSSKPNCRARFPTTRLFYRLRSWQHCRPRKKHRQKWGQQQTPIWRQWRFLLRAVLPPLRHNE